MKNIHLKIYITLLWLVLSSSNGFSQNSDYCLKIKWIADNSYYQLYGNSVSSQVNTVLTEVENIFKNNDIDLDINNEGSLAIYTNYSTDPYANPSALPCHPRYAQTPDQGCSTVGKVLNKLEGNTFSVQADAVLLFSAQALSNHGISNASHGPICSSSSRVVGIAKHKTNRNTLSLKVQAAIMAHELIHNIRGDHYHDDIGTSLMSPAGPNNGWTSLNNNDRQKILSNLNSNNCSCNIATCSDNIQNQGETGKDCGGPCPNCQPQTSCFDNIQNQGETGKDCGGPCPACPTCFDDNLNGDETGVDCGGSCEPCENITITAPNWNNTHTQGDLVNIRWIDNIMENVVIKMFDLTNTESYYSVVNTTQSNGAYNYKIPSYIPEGQYRIKVESIINTTIYGYSNYFTINTPVPMSSCSDNIQNGNETGTDCGGSCPPCKADLNITSCASVSLSGNFITVNNVVIKNIGNATATSTTLGYYLSKDASINNNDYWVGGRYIPSLMPDATSTISFTIDISSKTPQIPEGTYYVGMLADYQSTLSEFNENNNTCYDNSPRFTVTYGCKNANAHNFNANATYTDNTICQTCSDKTKNGDETGEDCGGSFCDPCKPDLDITICGKVSKSGNSITVSNVKVKNIGNATASSTTLGYYLSKDVSINNNDYWVGGRYIPSLIPDATSTISFTIDISSKTPQIPEGTYYVGMLADYQSTLFEFNENNNTCYDNSPRFTVTYGCKNANAHNFNANATYTDNTICQTCSDETKNGDETGEDCGGSFCDPCFPDGCNHNDGLINGILNKSYEVQNYIISPAANQKATVPAYKKAAFDAGKFIELKPGFTTEFNSRFDAFIDGCGGVAPKISNPKAEIALRNYPNPFTGETTIEFTLLNEKPVTLFVTDIMGKTIATLLDNAQQTKGSNQVNFNGSNLPAGIYYYTLQTSDQIQTQKMILID